MQAYKWYIDFTKDKSVAKQQKLKKDLLVLKNELSQTSSQVSSYWGWGERRYGWNNQSIYGVYEQDEFAKWAKMRRKLDKGMADLEKLSKWEKVITMGKVLEEVLIVYLASDINFNKASFELRAKSVLWFLVHGTRTIIVMWFARQATFYLPKGWFGPAEWFLWMPFAPKGKLR